MTKVHRSKSASEVDFSVVVPVSLSFGSSHGPCPFRPCVSLLCSHKRGRVGREKRPSFNAHSRSPSPTPLPPLYTCFPVWSVCAPHLMFILTVVTQALYFWLVTLSVGNRGC